MYQHYSTFSLFVLEQSCDTPWEASMICEGFPQEYHLQTRPSEGFPQEYHLQTRPSIGHMSPYRV